MKIATSAATLGNSFRKQFIKAKELGYDCLELWLWTKGNPNEVLTFESNEEHYSLIRSLIDEFKIEVRSIVSASYWACGAFGSEDPAKSAEAVTLLRKQLEAASAIGADTILVVTNLDDETGYQKSIDLTIKVFRELEDEIKEAGINIGLENVTNRFFMSPIDVKYILDAIDNPLVGLYFDIGNMVEFSRPEDWIEPLAPYIKKVHIKDFKRNGDYFCGGAECALFEGDVDFEKCMKLLKECGYDDVITAEVFNSNPNLSEEEFLLSVSEAMKKIAKMAE